MSRSNPVTAIVLIALASTAFPSGLAAAPGDDGPAVTVYSTADPAGFDPQEFIAQQRQGNNPSMARQVPGFGVVKELREVALTAGLNTLRFTDVAQFIDPTTVSFTDLTDPGGTAVLEQNFEFDLVSPDKLLQKYIDREIRVDSVTGKLLSARGGRLVLQTSEGLRILNAGGQIELGDLPGGLITQPTLVWKLQSTGSGTHKVCTTYQTNGITWRSDYNLVLSAGDTKADLGAWVSLMNLSGAAYRNARLKLIAGDVQRIQPQPEMMRMMGSASAKSLMMDDEGFEEKSFFEYHLYTLPRRTDILSNTTQQITLFPTAREVGVEKVMVYYGLPQARYWSAFATPQQDRSFGNQSNPKLDVYLKFKNAKENKLGMPLPKGKVRVYKQDDADGTLEFIGEDLIDHTARNETVLIKLGQAFDVVGERTQTDFRLDSSRKTMTESIRIQLRNHKDAAQKVIIKENLYRWTNWDITQKSDDFEKIDARTIHFNVDVPADGEKTVTYTVRYTW